MNDDFLHKLRVEPPPDFLARLKTTLDLQPPPKPPTKTNTFKKLLLGLLLTGSVFAITLMVLSRGGPDAPITQPEPAPAQNTPIPQSRTAAAHQAPTKHPTEPRPIQDTRPTTLAAPVYSYITTRSLEPFVKSFFPNGQQTIVATESTSEALSRFCTPTSRNTPTPRYVLLPRRITKSESDSCNRNVQLSEALVGHQVVVLARSKLYGAFNLTPAEIFLALSAEIPDPQHPDKRIPNPNTTWTDINSSLEREPVEFFGPEPASAVGVAFREVLFEAGCRSVLAITDPKECPGLRNDGVYTVAAATVNDMALKLQTKPNAIGILPFGLAFRNTEALAASPVGGVALTAETIANETYPGSRPLYAYYDQDGYRTPRGMANAFQSFTAEQYAVVPLERSQP